MPVPFFRRIFVLTVPTLVLVVTYLLIPKIAGMSPGRQELFLLAPYLITALGLFVSVHFHRGRPFMALLLLILFYWASHRFLVGKSLELSLNEIYQALVLLIPVNFLLITVMRERGIFSSAGKARLIFFAIQGFVAFWFFRYNFIPSLPVIAADLGLPAFMVPDQVPQPAMLAGCIVFIVVAALAVYRQASSDSSLLGALIAFFIASNWVTTPDVLTAFSAAGASILTLGVLRDTYNMAFKDEMTNLPSRRSLNDSLSGLGRKYTIAMIDVDHFKRFNDTYGHATGDQVLKMVASKMMSVGCGGKAYRYGGEEFTIIFPGRNAADVIPELERIRETIAECQLAIRSAERPKNDKDGKSRRGTKTERPTVSVTVSIGVAERGEDALTPKDVLNAADRALYRAKNRGRNQVCK